jgi:hypothetical protein
MRVGSVEDAEDPSKLLSTGTDLEGTSLKVIPVSFKHDRRLFGRGDSNEEARGSRGIFSGVP